MWIIFTDDPFFKGQSMYYMGKGAFNFSQKLAKKYETWEEADKDVNYIRKEFELETQVKKI